MNRARVLVVVRYGLLVLVLAAVVWALAGSWDEVSRELGRMSPPAVVLALVLTLGAPLCTLVGWRILLADLGTRLPLAPAASVFFVGQLGKYVPGSVWTVLAQAEMGTKLGVPRRRMAVTGLLSIGLAILCGSLLGVVALPRLLARGSSPVTAWVVVAAVVVGAVLFWPRLLNAMVALGLRVLRREPLDHELGGRAVLATAAWFTGAWVSAGLGVAVLVRSLQPAASLTDLAVAGVCGFALASAAGQLSVLVPAGVGVRDGVLALLLVTFMPLSAATAVVVVARFLAIVADLLVAGGGWAWGRRHHLLGSAG
ncbi:flippase-like domain-containing protein [Phycicoccus sp. MAQZ13P-2]|uniref:lysylphosphatidylglycerol synthase domain-containing protein n=1 Tax=Phycicoccus mangrovi TaxID=2840470 RepID=UPI001C00336F|nr:lysylphosphatidylglycerol synthase domain-containing protein [Phycicoccus mangrovi]MBT9255942.1 flippase-like domain-containing protein [Phycicoccus mangrovi]MBT9274536.1 flippase-like domain-containing protein [Phycicoccus mangrovi]